MKKTIIFVMVLIMVDIAIAASPYVCVGEGLFSSVFSGANITGDLMASDFLLYNGSSCCGGADTDTTAVSYTHLTLPTTPYV